MATELDVQEWAATRNSGSQTRRPVDWVCDSQREQRQARKMQARGIVNAKWRGSPGRMFARMGAFISLDAAADWRRAGRFQMAKYSLYHANRDHYAWVNRGGYLP